MTILLFFTPCCSTARVGHASCVGPKLHRWPFGYNSCVQSTTILTAASRLLCETERSFDHNSMAIGGLARLSVAWTLLLAVTRGRTQGMERSAGAGVEKPYCSQFPPIFPLALTFYAHILRCTTLSWTTDSTSLRVPPTLGQHFHSFRRWAKHNR